MNRLIAVSVLLLLIGLAIDASGVGLDSLRDKFAVIPITLGAYGVWANTDAGQSVTGWLVGAVKTVGVWCNATLSTAAATAVVSGLVAALLIYGVFGLMPTKGSEGGGGDFGLERGEAAGLKVLRMLSNKVSFEPRHRRRLNHRIWLLGLTLGVLAPAADIPGTIALLMGGIPPLATAFVADLGSGA